MPIYIRLSRTRPSHYEYSTAPTPPGSGAGVPVQHHSSPPVTSTSSSTQRRAPAETATQHGKTTVDTPRQDHGRHTTARSLDATMQGTWLSLPEPTSLALGLLSKCYVDSCRGREQQSRGYRPSPGPRAVLEQKSNAGGDATKALLSLTTDVSNSTIYLCSGCAHSLTRHSQPRRVLAPTPPSIHL